MTRADMHFLNCTDRDCEKSGCVARRDYEQKILRLENKLKNLNSAIMRKNQGENKMAKLELALLVGAESKQWLSDLTDLVERIEAIGVEGLKGSSAKRKPTTAAESEEEEEATPKKRKAKSEDEEDNFDLDQDEDTKKASADDEEEQAEEEEEEIPLKKVIKACAANPGAARKLLTKWGINNVNKLPANKRAKFMRAIEA